MVFRLVSVGVVDMSVSLVLFLYHARRVGAWVFIRGGVLAVYCVATRVYQRV